MLSDEIRSRMIEAMKAHRDVEKAILRVALGEIQSTEVSRGKPLDDEEVATLLRKLVKSNEESLAAAKDPAQKASLEAEVEVLNDLLPKTLSEEEIVGALAPVLEAIRGAKNDGQATGVAMKHLRQAGASVTGQDVAKAVRTLRA